MIDENTGREFCRACNGYPALQLDVNGGMAICPRCEWNGYADRQEGDPPSRRTTYDFGAKSEYSLIADLAIFICVIVFCILCGLMVYSVGSTYFLR